MGKRSRASAEEWVRRKQRSKEFFQACFVDEDQAILVDEAQRSGEIDMSQARELWKEICHHRIVRH